MSAFSPIFYFQGKEKLGIVTVAEIIVALLTLSLIAIGIKSASDFEKLPAILLGARAIGLFLMIFRLRQNLDAGDRWFDGSMGLKMIREGFSLFVFQGAVTFYTSFNVVMVGFFCPQTAVGAYAAADKLMKIPLVFIGQASAVVFPRMNSLKADGSVKLRKIRLVALAAFALLGLAATLATILLSPMVIRLLFSGRIEGIDKTLRVMALAAPAIAVNWVLAFHYVVVDKKEKILNYVMATAGLVNIALGYLLIVKMGAIGMAWSWVTVEWLIALALGLVVITRSRIDSDISIQPELRQ